MITCQLDDISDRLHSNKCTNCKPSLDYMKVENNQLIFKCLNCNKNYNNNFNKELINRFSNTYKFNNGDIDKFILLLRKGVYPYKEDFYSCLNVEDITDIDYRHEKRVLGV